MSHAIIVCHDCGVVMSDDKLVPGQRIPDDPDTFVVCRFCHADHKPENVLDDAALKELRRERQAIVRRKWIDGIRAPEEQQRLKDLTKKLYLHWRITDPPPKGVQYPPFWSKCYVCGAPMKTEAANHEHWQVCEIRRLDNDIAERAMGWVLDEDQLGNRYWVGSWHDYDRRGMSEHQCGDSFNPARDMRHAHWAMNKLESNGWVFEIASGEDDHAVTAHRPDGRVGRVEHVANLPEAVCRAILAALE